MILGGVAFRLSTRRNLGHVHNYRDADLLRSLSKVRRGLQDTWHDRVHKVRALRAFEGCADGFEVRKISAHNLGALSS